MNETITRKLNILSISGIFANLQTGKLQEDSFQIPTGSRFNPESARQIDNLLRAYLLYKDFPLIPVKITASKHEKDVPVECNLFDALDVFKITKA